MWWPAARYGLFDAVFWDEDVDQLKSTLVSAGLDRHVANDAVLSMDVTMWSKLPGSSRDEAAEVIRSSYREPVLRPQLWTHHDIAPRNITVHAGQATSFERLAAEVNSA